jgi:SAM-dependent methyltransferase
MAEYEAGTYGERIADVYDAIYEGRWDTDGAVELLAGLAGAGPVLELGIGTGRLALPLAERGIEVHGIDVSEQMVAKLREKPGGETISVLIGDFADVGIDGPFTLVYVAVNTFFGLLSQEAQVRCFGNVAARLKPGGAFAIEAFVPDPARYTRGGNLECLRVETEDVTLVATRHDPANQTLISQYVVLTEGGIRLYPAKLRYAWPSELDLMAQLAGLRLRERWASWQRAPFTASSTGHVSIYGRLSDGS